MAEVEICKGVEEVIRREIMILRTKIGLGISMNIERGRFKGTVGV